MLIVDACSNVLLSAEFRVDQMAGDGASESC